MDSGHEQASMLRYGIPDEVLTDNRKVFTGLSAPTRLRLLLSHRNGFSSSPAVGIKSVGSLLSRARLLLAHIWSTFLRDQGNDREAATNENESDVRTSSSYGWVRFLTGSIPPRPRPAHHRKRGA
jgi:hypothetical protein